jgi:hypothetical protein
MKQKLITEYFENSIIKKIKLDYLNISEELVYGYNPKTDS